MAGRTRALASLLAALCVMTLGVTAPRATAAEGALTEVTDFGPNPGQLKMFEYVPEGLRPGAPLVVVMHGCFGSASAYDDETGWTQLADERKWALVFPQQQLTNNDTLCFNWVSEDDIRRGKGESQSIVQMVRWMRRHHKTDSRETYVTGHSAGGYFTSVMLATNPDLFAAGAVVSGGPYRCATYQRVYLAPPGAWVDAASVPLELSARMACTQAGIDKTPQQWGDLLRLGHSTYGGPKPRVALWHGSIDDVVVPKNFHELVEQWTNYHGIDTAPDVSDTVEGYPHEVHENEAGEPVIETYLLTDRGHSYPGDGSADCPGQENAGVCAVTHIADWFEASAAR